MLLALALVGLFVLPSPWNVVGVVVAAVLEVAELWLWMRFLRRYRVRGGAEGMVGERASVIEACDPRGRVKVRGEIWEALARDGLVLAPGDRARVVAVEGLRLVVEPGEEPRR